MLLMRLTRNGSRPTLTSSHGRLYHLAMSFRMTSLALTGWLVLSAVAVGEDMLPTSVSPRTLSVALDGSAQFRSIQEAIDQAMPGDTILIRAGEYAEDVTIHSKERIKIIGEGVDRVIILG